MKALGTFFFGQQELTILLEKEKEKFSTCQKKGLNSDLKPLRALAINFFDTKVRFYPLPKVKPYTQKKLLLGRLLNDPMLELHLLKFSFKNTPLGVEVHFVEKKGIESFFRDFDFITSAQQALFRYLRDFKRIKEPVLVVVKEKKQILCLHYTPHRWEAFASVDASTQCWQPIQKVWGLNKTFFLLAKNSLEESGETESGELLPIEALSIGASIEALDTEGVSFYEPTENEDFQKELIVKSKNFSFFLSLLCISFCLFLHLQTEKRHREIDQEIIMYKDLEDFPKYPTKNAKKVSSLLKELSTSLEPFELELMEFEVKQELIEKKPYLEMRFCLSGESQQMEKYEQSVRKISGSFLSKMQPLSEGKKGDFSLKFAL